jgi:serine phosphatase RsbU (regulator of sigma subunit)
MPDPAPTAPASTASHRSRIGRKITFLALGATLAATLIVAWIGYRAVLASAMGAYDAKLRAVALAYPDLVPDGYHARVQARAVSPEEYTSVCDRLDRFADVANVYYLYSFIEENGELLNAATSDRPDERGPGARTPLREKYKQPPPAIFEALKSGGPTYADYTDEFGAVRSVFLAVGDGPNRCVVGVDIALAEIQQTADRVLARTVGIALAVSALVGALGVWLGRGISRPITDLTRNVATFVDDDFSDDHEAERALEIISGNDKTETGELAATLLFQQRRLKEYLAAFEKATQEKQHIISQLQIAREIQIALLPKESPKLPGYDIAGWSEAADQAGGDFYDWVADRQERIVLSVADVTGHGIGPAIMASVCRAHARATIRPDQALTAEQTLTRRIDRLNRLMSGDLSDARFVTYFSSVLDTGTHQLTYVSAGHGPVLIYRARDGSVEEAHVHGVPLGVVPDFEFDPQSVADLAPGDIVLMASDGFWEYPNPEHELFGVERLKTSLRSAAGLPAAAIIDQIRADVAAHVRGVQQPDDMTAIVLKRV